MCYGELQRIYHKTVTTTVTYTTPVRTHLSPAPPVGVQVTVGSIDKDASLLLALDVSLFRHPGLLLGVVSSVCE